MKKAKANTIALNVYTDLTLVNARILRSLVTAETDIEDVTLSNANHLFNELTKQITDQTTKTYTKHEKKQLIFNFVEKMAKNMKLMDVDYTAWSMVANIDNNLGTANSHYHLFNTPIYNVGENSNGGNEI